MRRLVVRKLDARFRGSACFKYYIRVTKATELHELRVRCWEWFGPGVSVEACRIYSEIKWGWHEDETHYRYRILLKEEKDATWIALNFNEAWFDV